MSLLSHIRAKVDWKKNLEKKTNNELIALYSETTRINLEPQIYAGKILKKRNFNNDELIRIKDTLIASLIDKFERKYGKDEGEIRKDNLMTVLFHRIIAGVLVFVIVWKAIRASDMFHNVLFELAVPLLVSLTSLFPLFNLTESHEKAIDQANAKKIQLQKNLEKLENELNFENESKL